MNLLSTEQVAEELGVPVKTVRWWRYVSSTGAPVGPPSFKVGRYVKYSRDDLDTWIRAQRNATRTA